jgi:hypothetical protein
MAMTLFFSMMEPPSFNSLFPASSVNVNSKLVNSQLLYYLWTFWDSYFIFFFFFLSSSLVAKLALFLSVGMYVMVVGGYVARAAGEPSIIKVSFHLFVI